MRLLPDLGYPVTPMLAKHHPSHVGVGARRDRFSTIDEWGRRCLREPAHGLGEWPRAIARRGRRLSHLKISGPSVVARMLVWACDATDFRPSRNGVGGACASRRTVWESVGGRSRAGAGSLPTLEIRSQPCLHTCWRGRSTGPIFDRREAAVGAGWLPCTVCESVGGRSRDGAGCLQTSEILSSRT